MAGRNAHEDQDTLKFRVPRQQTTDNEHTRVYQRSEITGNSQTRPQKRTPSENTKNQQNSQRSNENYSQNQQQNYGKSRPAKRKKKKTFGGFLRRLILIAIALFFVYSAVALHYITKIESIESTEEYINDPETMLYSSDVKNILIIGEDARDVSTRGLSDSIILLSVNKKNHKLQMTSFMRDIYTEIDGYDYDKINAAYSYGGAALLKDTIEDNFKIRIDGCVTLNFIAVAHIVDAVGGVQITLSPEEANAVNEILYSEVNEIMGDAPEDDFLPDGGTYILDGKQALSYSRIRYIGDADFERTQRQRTVITQVFSRMKKINPIKFNSGITKALEYIGTDMNVTDMYILSLRLPSLLTSYETEQLRVPSDGTWSFGETWDGMSIINVDFYANTEYLKNNIYLQ